MVAPLQSAVSLGVAGLGLAGQSRCRSLRPRSDDIQRLLVPGSDVSPPDLEEQIVDLWDPVSGAVPGAINHSPDEW